MKLNTAISSAATSNQTRRLRQAAQVAAPAREAGTTRGSGPNRDTSPNTLPPNGVIQIHHPTPTHQMRLRIASHRDTIRVVVITCDRSNGGVPVSRQKPGRARTARRTGLTYHVV